MKIKNIKLDLIKHFDNELSCLNLKDVDIDFYRDCVANKSYLVIKKIFKNDVEIFYHIPLDNIFNLNFENYD